MATPARAPSLPSARSDRPAPWDAVSRSVGHRVRRLSCRPLTHGRGVRPPAGYAHRERWSTPTRPTLPSARSDLHSAKRAELTTVAHTSLLCQSPSTPAMHCLFASARHVVSSSRHRSGLVSQRSTRLRPCRSLTSRLTHLRSSDHNARATIARTLCRTPFAVLAAAISSASISSGHLHTQPGAGGGKTPPFKSCCRLVARWLPWWLPSPMPSPQ